MPELPEVETVRIQLWKKVKGLSIKDIEILNLKSVKNNPRFAKELVGLSIKDIDRIGKLLIFSFKENSNIVLLTHLKMTGQLFFVDHKGKVGARGGHETPHDHSLPNRHTRVIVNFNEGGTLYFNDQRIFGYLELADKAGVALARARFGPEPSSNNFDFEQFFTKLQRSKQNIKARLLDQTFIAGLGNIYVDETLFRSGIDPRRPADKITRKEAQKIIREASKVLKEAIEHGGTTFQTFKDSKGQKGNYTTKLKVFSRQGHPCLKCKSIIQKTRVAGRGTHYCSICQK